MIVVVKIIESIETGEKKKRILECVNDMESMCQLLKKILPLICDEEEIEDIETIVVDTTDNLNDIRFDDENLQSIVID